MVWNKGLIYEQDKRIARPWLGKKRSSEDIEKFRHSHLIPKIPFKCKKCGKTIYLKPYQTKGRKYCSVQCRNKALKKQVTLTCHHCGKFYQQKVCLKNVSHYCSRQCQNKALALIKKKRAKIELKCAICEKSFITKISQLKIRPARYCSKACLHKARKKILNQPKIKNKIRHSVNQRYVTHPETKQKIREARLRQIFPAKDTYIEVALQKELERRGINYQKHVPVLGVCQPDVVFPEQKIAVFADGDYWHTKDKKVIAKDKFQNETLKSNGWQVLRFWEKEINANAIACVDKIEAVLLPLM